MEPEGARSNLRIVAALSLSPSARAVAGEALFLARTLGAETLFVHGGDDHPATRGALAGALHPFGVEEESANLVVEPGRAESAVCAAARRLGAGLIVAGRGGTAAARGGAPGSGACAIVRKAPCSVLLLPAPRPTGTRFRVIALAELSGAEENGVGMAGFAGELARRHYSSAVHVLEEIDAEETRDASTLDSIDPLYHPEDAGLRRGNRSLADQEELRSRVACVEYVPLAGRDGEGILRYVQGQPVDLLVLPAPSEGLTWWDRVFSHPLESLLKRCPCAALFHRPGPISELLSANDGRPAAPASPFVSLL